ncbi:hypothetical protein PanWU01x14_039920, partial [Parasponia andersonii]
MEGALRFGVGAHIEKSIRRFDVLVEVCAQRLADEFGPSTSCPRGDHRHQRSISTFQITSHHYHQYYSLECAEKKITINSAMPCLDSFLWNVPRHRYTGPDDHAGRDDDDREAKREREGEKNLTSHPSNNSTLVVVAVDDDNDNDWEGEIDQIGIERKRKRKTTKQHSSFSSSSTLTRRKRPNNMNGTNSDCSSEKDSPPPDRPRAINDFVKGRLMPGSQESIKSNNFLRDDKISTLTKRLDDGHYQGMPVRCYFHPYSAEEDTDMVLRKWEYRNGSRSYVLSKNWYKVASRKGFNMGDNIGVADLC